GFSEGKRFVSPITRVRRGPLFLVCLRERVKELPGSRRYVVSDRVEDQAIVPGGMKIWRAFTGHVDVVAAAVILEGNVQRLMNVANPMAEELQCRQLFIIISRRRQLFRVLLDRGEHADIRGRALIIRRYASCVSFEIDEMLRCSLARVIWPRAGVGKEIELAIQLDEPADFGPRLRCRQAEREIAHDLVARVTPRKRRAGLSDVCRERKRERSGSNQFHGNPPMVVGAATIGWVA